MLGCPPASHQAYVAFNFLFSQFVSFFSWKSFIYFCFHFLSRVSLSPLFQKDKKPEKNCPFRFENLLWSPISLGGKVRQKSCHIHRKISLARLSHFSPEKWSPISLGGKVCRKSCHIHRKISLAGLSHFSPEKLSIFTGKSLPFRQKISPSPEKLSLAGNLFLTGNISLAENISLARKAPLLTGAHFFH